MDKRDPDRTTPMPADHEFASPESGDRAQPTKTGSAQQHHSGPETDPVQPEPSENEYASPESGDHSVPPQHHNRPKGS